MTRGVSVVVPTYNEAESVRGVVEGVRESLSRPCETIVVDDDSPDGTADRVREAFGGDDDVRCLVRTEESGLSSAVVRGFDAASHDYLAVIDADGQHPAGALSDLAARLDEGADVAVGSRHADGGTVEGSWPLHRRAISAGAHVCAGVMIPQARALTDPLSGLFVARSDVVESARDRLDPCGYKILLELLARCPVDDVREVGITFSDREHGDSNLGAREYLEFVRHLARLSVPARREGTHARGNEHGAD